MSFARIQGPLILVGSSTGSVTLEAQGTGADVQYLLPNTLPASGKFLSITSVSADGHIATLNWVDDTDAAASTPGGSTGQLQFNNATAFDGAAHSSVDATTGAVVLGNVTDPSPVSTTAFTVSASGGITIHAQDWFSSNEGFVVASMTTAGYLQSQGLNIASSISVGANVPLAVHGSTLNQDIAQFITSGSASPATTKTVWIDWNGVLNAASPVFTGSITVPAVAATSGSDLTLSAASTNKVRISTATGAFDFFGTGGGMDLASQNAHVTISAAGAIGVSPASGQDATVTNTKLTGTLKDGSASVGGNGDLLSSTVTGTAYIAQSSLTIAEGQVTGLTSDLAAKVSKAAVVDTPGLTDNVGPTVLLSAPASSPSHMYRVSAYLYVTTADGVSSTLPKVTISWIDDAAQTQTKDITALVPGTDNAGGTFDQGDVYVVANAAGSNISYQTQGYASNTPNAMTYNLRVRLEAL